MPVATSVVDSDLPVALPITHDKSRRLTTGQLHRIIAIKEQIEALQGQIDSIAGGGGEIPIFLAVEVPKRRRMGSCFC